MLVRCNSCRGEISREAKTCPHCGQPDPYTLTDARLDSAIHQHVQRQMDIEGYVVFGAMALGVLFGWLKWGGWLGAVIGFLAGGIVAGLLSKWLR